MARSKQRHPGFQNGGDDGSGTMRTITVGSAD
jgi:hypothetical protein